MGVFDGKIATKLKVTDPLTDHTLPHPRSLSFKSITETTALTGTKGSQCHLLHGDHWNEIKGNHIENIAQNQTIKVVGKHKETLVGKCYQNIIGPHVVQNNDVRNETRLDRFNLVYGQNELTSAQVGNLSVLGVLGSAVLLCDFEFAAIKVEFTPVHAEFKLVHYTMDILDEQVATTSVQLAGTSVQSAVTSISAAGNTVTVDANRLATSVSETLTSLQNTWVGVARINAGMHLGTTASIPLPH